MMLDVAINHEYELKKLFRETWFSDKYKFWANNNYYQDFEVVRNTYDQHQFVSLNSEGKVIGYIGCALYRNDNSVDGVSAINFTDNQMTFGVDLGTFLIDIFEKFHFRKISFTVTIGNPIEKSYDKLIEKHHGRIVGTRKKHIMLFDGKLYDEKLYEIFAEDYFASKEIKQPTKVTTTFFTPTIPIESHRPSIFNSMFSFTKRKKK